MKIVYRDFYHTARVWNYHADQLQYYLLVAVVHEANAFFFF